VRGSSDRLTFVSELPAASGLATSRVDVALGVDGARRLVLRSTPRPAGKPFGPPPLPLDTELLRDVERIELAYWPRGPAPQWRNAWSANDLPLLVRLRVIFPPGDRRHWPDIVAGTRLERAVGA